MSYINNLDRNNLFCVNWIFGITVLDILLYHCIVIFGPQEFYFHFLIIACLHQVPLMKNHKPSIRILQQQLSWAFHFHRFQSLFILLISASNPRANVFLGLSLFCFSSGFEFGACFVMQLSDFFNTCPIHFQRLFLVSFSAECWFLSHSRWLQLFVSSQWTLIIFRKKMLRDICTFLMMVVAVLQVSAPYTNDSYFTVCKSSKMNTFS